VQLGRIRARPRYTVCGAARGQTGHGPCAQRGAAHGHAVHGLSRSQRARPACAALAQLGLGRVARTAALLGDGRRLDAGAQRRRGGGGSPARRRRRGVTATGNGRAREAAAATTALLGQRAHRHGRSGWQRCSRGGCRRRERGGQDAAHGARWRSVAWARGVELGGTECGLSGRGAVPTAL
jgi:hypothetical protein